MSASAAPAACASDMPAPIAPRGFVVRSHRAAAPPVASSGRRRHLAGRLVGGRRCSGRRASRSPAVARSSTSIRSSRAAIAESTSRVIRRPVALPPACTTRRTECRPRARARARRGGPRRTDAERLEVAHARALRAEDAAGALAHVPRGPRRACRRDGGPASPPRLSRRRGRPAPSSWRTGRAASSIRGRHAPRARSHERRVEARRRRRRPRRCRLFGWERCATRPSGADYGTWIGSPLYFRHRSSLDHETGTHPERTARILAIEEELGARLAGSRAARGAGRRTARLDGDPPGALRGGDPPIGEAGGGMLDADTIASAGSYEAALHAAGGALRDGRRAARRAGTFAFCGMRPPGHHAERATRDGLLPLQQRRDCSATRARHAAERVLVLDWDVHHGNGTNDIFHASRRRALREHPPVAALSRHRPAVRHRLRAGRASRSTSRCRRVRRARPGCRWFSTWSRRRRASSGRARPRVGRLRRAPRRPAGVMRARGRVLRRDGGDACASSRPSWQRRWASCSRAGTRSARSRAWSRPRSRRSAATRRRPRSSRTRSPRGRSSSSAAGGRSRRRR